jgi:hypothetical protein
MSVVEFAPELPPNSPQRREDAALRTRSTYETPLQLDGGEIRTPGALASTTVFEGSGLGPASVLLRVWMPFCAAGIPLRWRPVR